MITNVTAHDFHHTKVSRYGGYILYWQLYRQLWGQARIAFKICSASEYAATIFLMILKTPWWLVIKPLGVLFSKKTISKGFARSENDVITHFEGEKFIVMRFLAIPFLAWGSTDFSDEEMKKHAR
jgi:hypothetical protein